MHPRIPLDSGALLRSGVTRDGKNLNFLNLTFMVYWENEVERLSQQQGK